MFVKKTRNYELAMQSLCSSNSAVREWVKEKKAAEFLERETLRYPLPAP
jgi:hypothetical protein